MIVYDVKHRRMVEDYPGGTVGNMSLHRLATEVLRKAGELRNGEDVTHLVIDADGLRFRTEARGRQHGR